MPAPLTTTLLTVAFLCVLLGSAGAAIAVVTFALLNQFAVEYAHIKVNNDG